MSSTAEGEGESPSFFMGGADYQSARAVVVGLWDVKNFYYFLQI